MDFPVHTLETATDPGKDALAVSLKTYGSIPNIHGVMAGSPMLLRAYQVLNDLFLKTSLTRLEQHVVWLTANYANDCTYCMAAHSAIAKMGGMNDADLAALRSGAPLADSKLQTLRAFTAHMIAQRGWPEPEALQAMEAAGYGAETVLDVIFGIGMKTLSNYVNHVASTPLDKGFEKFAWHGQTQDLGK